uniref:uncharacterized protein isoform X4 n=1 Tax=Myxine glutinosa TaxID=7769 RepID=UPI00358E28BD
MSVLVGAADPQQDFSAWLGAQGMKPRFAEAMDRDLGINDYDDLLACTEDAQVLVEFFNVAREKLPFAPYAVLRRIIKMVISEKERGDGHRNSNEEASVELLTEQPVVLGLLQTMVALLSNLGQELFQAAERFGALTDTFHSNTPDENEDVHTNEFVGVGEEGSLVVKVEDLNTSIRPNFEDDAVPMWKNYGSDDVTTDVRLIGGSESAPLPGRKEGEDSLNEVVEDPNVEEELKEGYGGDEEESHPDKCDSSMITGGSQWWPCKVKSEPSFGDSGGGETGREAWGALPLQMDFSPEAEPSGHVLMPLPQRKARDCEVCGKNRAIPGGRKRSRHWCPGCGVGVHEHCYHRLVHFRRINRRGRKNSKTYIYH